VKYGPMLLFTGLALATVLLTMGSAFHEEVSDDENTHYEALGVKRMAKAIEIEVAYEKLLKIETNEERLIQIEEAYKIIHSPQSRRTYDRGTQATRDDLYYRQIESLTQDNFEELVAQPEAKTSTGINPTQWKPWLIEVHGASHRPPRAGSIHVPPNWGRLLAKTAKVLQGYVRLGRINTAAQPELAAELGLAQDGAPMIVTYKDGKIVYYSDEPRILKLCDFVGEQFTESSADKLTYNNFDEWRKSDTRVKVVLFRKNFTRMVMVFREAARSLGESLFRFGEIDVRIRGAVNLWRRQGMRRMPLVAVLRDDEQNPALLGGSFNRKMLDNFLLSNRLPIEFPRLSSENIEEVCLAGSKRYCVILAVDPRYVSHKQVNTSMDVFLQASEMIAKVPALAEANAQFCWADKVGDYVNTTESWKSLHSIFGTTPELYTIHLFITDNLHHSYKDFGGNLFKVTDWTEKEIEMKDFVEEFLLGKLKTTPMPTPLFRPPPSPPMTQEEKSKLLVGCLVCSVVLVVLGWSFVTFKKEEKIREELINTGQLKKKKEKRDADYSLGD